MSNEQTVAPPPASAPPMPPPAMPPPPVPPTETVPTDDLLGTTSSASGEAVSPSGAAAAAVMAEAVVASGAGAAEIGTIGSVDTEESEKTEESESSSSSGSSASGDDSGDSSDSESSSSSEDPSVVGMDMRKPPPETLGISTNNAAILSTKSSDSEDPELGVLTKEQVLGTSEKAAASLLYEDDPEAAQTGTSFYSAYGDVTRMVGAGTALDDDNQQRPGITSQRSQRGPQLLGQDRASVRTMVAHRMKGKGYNRSRRGKKRNGHSRGTNERMAGSSRSRRAHQTISPRGGEGSEGWSNPKKRRVCYALFAVAIAIAGVSLIVFGVTKERAYNRAKDDDYYYNDDFGVTEEEEDEYNDGNSPNAPVEEKSPIHSIPDSPTEPAPAPPVPVPVPVSTPRPTPPPTPSPTPKATTIEDDALLSMLTQSYANALGSIDDTLAEKLMNELDRATMSTKPASEQSSQWKSYLNLYEQRTDIIDKTANKLMMEYDRILQIYALSVFYETFGWPREGNSECQWPGVSCRGGLGMNPDPTDPSEDDLRVVALNVRGLDGGNEPYGPLLEGELPTELMFLRDLETLDVSHNLIGGELNGAMFHWKNMKVLELNDNRLEGDIPTALGNLPNLQKLTLHHNEFLGQVPQNVCDLRQSSLHFLWVDCSPMPSTDIPKVACPIENCCSICFEGYDDDGGPGTGGTSPSSVGQETNHEVQNDILSDLKTKLSDASVDKGAALLDISSPQFRAYAWLVEDSEFGGGYTDEKRLLQRYALATLYFATNGVHWTKSDNWITLADECDWFGISGCEDADTEEIISIELKENRLQGGIPPELFEFLPSVVVLNLATNELSGPIPKEIGMLKAIDILELAENQLTSVPAELGNLNSISHVFLQANDFGGQGMPDEVCTLRTSGSLTLLWADCRGDEASLQCDPSCCTTCFSGQASSSSASGGTNGGGGDNPFNGGTGSKSDEAVTHADSDGEVLATLKKMAPDDGVSLDDSLSPQFKAYSWLVGSNRSSYENLSDVLLLQRYAMATLYFSLAGHGWTDKEGWLSDEDVCVWESVEECNGVEMVTDLELYSNNLVGRIPVEITHVRMLELLDLTDNELYGSIPTEFGWFEDLEILRLGGNLLTGTIPPQLGSLSTLHELYLHVNDFTGTRIPDEICALRRDGGNGLTTLWADCKDDTGLGAQVACEESCCDKCFDDDSDFEYYGGHIDGTYSPTSSPSTGPQIPGRDSPPTASPVATSAPTQVENLGLRTVLLNHMSDSPTLVDRLSNTSSHAYEAFMWLGNSRHFEDLDEFQKLQRYGLVTFYLSSTPEFDWKISNRWKTKDPECGWFGISCADNITVTEISLPSNRMSGTIPPEIALAGLGGKIGKLNLSGNNIGGKLVEQIGTLKHLEVLDLRANDFTGEIPSEIGELTELKSLRLQANELTGDMPPEICALTDGILGELVADCDSEDPFSKVTCDINACCTECY